MTSAGLFCPISLPVDVLKFHPFINAQNLLDFSSVSGGATIRPRRGGRGYIQKQMGGGGRLSEIAYKEGEEDSFLVSPVQGIFCVVKWFHFPMLMPMAWILKKLNDVVF